MNFGIDHHQRHQGLDLQFAPVYPGSAGAILEGGHHIDHGELKRAADLMGSYSTSILLVHGSDHFLRESTDRVIDLFDLLSLAAQSGMTVLHHFEWLDE
jgi:hypothetical protein